MIETSLASIAESLKIIAAALQQGCPSAADRENVSRLAVPGPPPAERVYEGVKYDNLAPSSADKPIDPIPEPVPAEVSFDDLKTRLFKLRDTGKVWPAGSAGNEKIKEWLKAGWSVKSLQEATPEQRVLIWTAVAGLEMA